jgi:hypothetical protein
MPPGEVRGERAAEAVGSSADGACRERVAKLEIRREAEAEA